MNNSKITIQEPTIADEQEFISAMQRSKLLHQPWVKSPLNSQEYAEYLERFAQSNQKSFLVKYADTLVGVINISEIVRGVFQNAYLGFYAVADHAGKGYMSAGLKLVLQKVFNGLGLHRLEANIQPGNSKSIQLVKNNNFRYEGFSPRYLKMNNVWCGHEHWALTYEDFIRDEKTILAQDHVEIVAYDPMWKHAAEVEIKKLSAIFSNRIIDIQHVGSTAIPGMAAKPILDILIAAKSLAEMKVIAIPELQKLGYEYWDANPDQERMFFVKGMPPYGDKRTHHIHIVEPSSKHWVNKIAFRDYLITHPVLAKEYAELKVTLANQYALDREEYTNAKTKFVNKILHLISDES